MPTCNVLWIEDGAVADLPHLAARVIVEDRFELDIAENATDAVECLRVKRYDVVIVDIRIPPGSDKHWEDVYVMANSRNKDPRLGLKLLEQAMDPAKRTFVEWLTPTRVGILTVEEETPLEPTLQRLGIDVFLQKTPDIPETALLDMITYLERRLNVDLRAAYQGTN